MSKRPSRPAVKPVPSAPSRRFLLQRMRASEPVAASAGLPAAAESPRLVAGQGEADAAPKVEATKADAQKIEASKPDAPRPDASKPDAPRAPGKVMIMSPGDRAWDSDAHGGKSEPGSKMSGKRRLGAVAAVAVLAAVAGALGGALATARSRAFRWRQWSGRRQSRARSLRCADRRRHRRRSRPASNIPPRSA